MREHARDAGAIGDRPPLRKRRAAQHVDKGVNFNIVTMTSWLPDLDRFSGPRYRVIAEALAADIRDGRLPPGSRLPTHRDLAWRLHVTVGTVSRAYAEAERRGLIGGEVGRGT